MRMPRHSWHSAPSFALNPPSNFFQVQAWALKNSGSFFRNGGGFVAWKDAAVDRKLAQQIKWGSLKSPTRAVEKLLRSYQGDVSMLLDLSRCVST